MIRSCKESNTNVTKIVRGGLSIVAAVLSVIGGGSAWAQKASDATPEIRRSNLANIASFTVTSVLSPQGGSKVIQVFRVEVKGNQARMDYSDPAIGAVSYIANGKGVYFVIPANKTAVRQNVSGGVDQALQIAFAQANERLKSAKRIGTTAVSGIPTDIYKDAKTGMVIYVGKKPGFRLPVKTLLTNEGGSRSITVSDIKTNISLPDSHFALPVGVQIIDGEKSGLPTPGRG